MVPTNPGTSIQYFEFDKFLNNDDCCTTPITYSLVSPINMNLVYEIISPGEKIRFYALYNKYFTEIVTIESTSASTNTI